MLKLQDQPAAILLTKKGKKNVDEGKREMQKCLAPSYKEGNT
jgi:hypothetical protein